MERGSSCLRILLFLTLMSIAAIFALPMVFQKLSDIEQQKAQNRAEKIVASAAKWYVINNGPPTDKMGTEEVEKALIPFYLNRWPGKKPINCQIDPNGNIQVYTKDDELGTRSE